MRKLIVRVFTILPLLSFLTTSGFVLASEPAGNVSAWKLVTENLVIAQTDTPSRGGQGLSCQFPGADPWRCRSDRKPNRGEKIAVIYPEVVEPELTQYSEIIEGVEQQSKTQVVRFPVGVNLNGLDLGNELRRQSIRSAIALGRYGVKAISGLDRDFDIVVSGIISAPEVEPRGITVHSLAPDPYLLFALFKSLVPGARRVFVVYDPTKNAWLIRIAKEAAKNLGLELVAQEASDLKAAMNLYQSVMASVDPKRDAIWLPQDSVTVDETLVLPKVLKEAWNRNLIVFSSNAAYVKQGVLFSLYPDNRCRR